MMDKISQQLLYQRLRNRVIDVLEIYSSLDDLAKLGAFEAIERAFDQLPLEYDRAPNVFADKERKAISDFFYLVESASNVADEDTWNVDWFKTSTEWVRLSTYAKSALAVMLERGRFSEEKEEPKLAR